MKTLDEVIKAMEICDSDEGTCRGCAYEADCDKKASLGHERKRADALHYLKEYREMLNTRIYIPEGYTREKTGFTHQDFANTFREEPHFIRDFMVGTSQNLENTSQNAPLTWDELRQMEGMPIWIEDSFDNGEWYIIECFTASNRFVAHDRWGDTTLFNKKEMDDVWKAYRKERS